MTFRAGISSFAATVHRNWMDYEIVLKGAKAFLNAFASACSSSSVCLQSFQSTRWCNPNIPAKTILPPLACGHIDLDPHRPAELKVKVPLQQMHHLCAVRTLDFEVVPSLTRSCQSSLRFILPIDSSFDSRLFESGSHLIRLVLRHRYHLDMGVSAATRQPSDFECDWHGVIGSIACSERRLVLLDLGYDRHRVICRYGQECWMMRDRYYLVD